MRYLLAAMLLLNAHPGHGPDDHDHDHDRPMTIIQKFPLAPEFYQEHTAALVKADIPQRYGSDEWAAVVLTHEVHQHIGVYTLLGAKMAVRAREVLDAPMRAVHVRSLTGRAQPLACLIDGLQVGLGSTFGQNLIEAPEVDAPVVGAEFRHAGKTVTLTLKPEYEQQIADFIRDAIAKHGNLTPEYFEAVEAYSYTVWAAFDRGKIFEEVMATDTEATKP